MANPFAPRNPIAIALQRCTGQNRKDFLSAAAIDSENGFFIANYSREIIYSPNLENSGSSREIQETRITDRGTGS